MWSHELKLRRAREHLEKLKADIDRWLHVDGFEITIEGDPEPPAYVIWAKRLRELEEEGLSLTIGDVLQNARAALDHFAFNLGQIGAGWRGMDERQARQSGFPIVPDEDAEGFSGRGPDFFAEAASRQLQTVSPEARAFIESYQPYQNAPAWRYDPLWGLHELARLDRHRELHLVAIRSGGIRPDPTFWRNAKLKELTPETGPVYFDLAAFGEPEDSAVLARFTAYPANRKSNMYMRFRDALTIGWAQETGVEVHGMSDDVIESLSSILTHISILFMKARPLLIEPEPPDEPPF